MGGGGSRAGSTHITHPEPQKGLRWKNMALTQLIHNRKKMHKPYKKKVLYVELNRVYARAAVATSSITAGCVFKCSCA